jgi:hypothetical protein
MTNLEHPFSKHLPTPTDPRARAVSGLDQPFAAQKMERAHDRRATDVEFLSESAFRGETRTRLQSTTDDCRA